MCIFLKGCRGEGEGRDGGGDKPELSTDKKPTNHAHTHTHAQVSPKKK